MDNDELALATMDDDGFGCAITASPDETLMRLSAHDCGRHCGPGYHPDAVTVRLIEAHERLSLSSFRIV